MLLDHAFPLVVDEQERGPDRAARRTVEAVATRARGSRILFNTTGHECAFLRGSRLDGISAFDNARTLHARHRITSTYRVSQRTVERTNRKQSRSSPVVDVVFSQVRRTAVFSADAD